AEIGDQKRVMTPQEAHAIGSDYIVVGRPIIQAENPWDAYHEIKRQWNA
ncbi:orotidine 5'-phosphate decarboxylase / HUMPS family protein, partial [Streptococcus sp. IMAU11618]